MSITDELREWVHASLVGLFSSGWERDLIAIADRIDKEHAEAVADALQLRGGPDRWVKLPVDADGVPIHVGDELEVCRTCSITAIGFGNVTEDDGTYGVFCQRDDGHYEWFNARFLRHVNPDSWVRIIGDAMSFEGDGWYSTRDDAMAELVERCRRLAGGDA